MKRPARLQSARHWLASLGATGELGRTEVRAYATRFRVDLGCALKELRLLGAVVDAGYADALKTALRSGPRRKARPAPTDIPEGYGEEWDDHHAYIAGFTSEGAPYGVLWEDADWLDDEHASP